MSLGHKVAGWFVVILNLILGCWITVEGNPWGYVNLAVFAFMLGYMATRR